MRDGQDLKHPVYLTIAGTQHDLLAIIIYHIIINGLLYNAIAAKS